MTLRHSWHIITGEYPPQSGGVSDYSEQVARGLAAAGEEVHVWAPPAPRGVPGSAPARALPPGGVQVHRLASRFGVGALRELALGLDKCPGPRRLLIQYVATGFGCRAMNLPFCFWLYGRRKETVWIMFHEYAYPVGWGLKLSHNLLGLVTPMMSAILAARAQRLFVSTPAWLERIPASLRAARPIEWLPIPSNIPAGGTTRASSAALDGLRRDGAGVLLGHFGTYGPHIAALLDQTLPALLDGRADRRLLLLGRGGPGYAAALLARHGGLAGRVAATGDLPAGELAAHLLSCDVMLQPYDDGATTRRGSLMACLALGKAVVTTLGSRSEDLWRESGAVKAAAVPDAGAFIAAAEELIASPALWPDLGRRAAALYHERFDIERTLETLRRAASQEEGRTLAMPA